MKDRLLSLVAPLVAAPPRCERVAGYSFGAGESPRRWCRRLRRRVLKGLPGPRAIRWRDGLKIHVHPNNETSSLLFLTGLFEPNEMSWLAGVLRPGMTFIDVGANLGVYTLFAARRVGGTGRVVALEPSSRERERLRANLGINGLAGVMVIAAAASDRRGEAELRVAQEPCSGHNTLGGFVYDATRTAAMERVELRTIDEIVREQELTRVDAVKIDAEGAEVAALRGASETIARFRPSLLVEVNDVTLGLQGASSQEIWEFFDVRGYALHDFDPASGMLRRAKPQARYDETISVVAVPL